MNYCYYTLLLFFNQYKSDTKKGSPFKRAFCNRLKRLFFQIFAGFLINTFCRQFNFTAIIRA